VRLCCAIEARVLQQQDLRRRQVSQQRGAG